MNNIHHVNVCRCIHIVHTQVCTRMYINPITPVHVCKHVHQNEYLCVHVYIYENVRICKYVLHKYIHVYMHLIHSQIYIRTYVYVYTYLIVKNNPRICIEHKHNMHTHTHTHTHTHKHTHAYTHTRTHTLSRSPSLSLSLSHTHTHTNKKLHKNLCVNFLMHMVDPAMP